MSGPQCCANPPALNPNCGQGSLVTLGGLDCYVSGTKDSKLAILLISDVFGYEAPLLRKLADKVAAAGFYAVVPDLLHGDPYDSDNAERPLNVWIKDHSPEKGFEEAKPVIQALKEQGVSKVGAVGFCWGAKVVVLLAAQTEYVQAAVLCHPSFVTVDDVKAVKAPIAILGGEFDEVSPPELIKQFDEVLKSKPEVDSYTKIFPGVGHGWTIRYQTDDAAAVKAAEEAHQDMLEWFSKYIK